MEEGVVYWGYISKKKNCFVSDILLVSGMRGALIVNAFDSDAISTGSSLGRGHCVVSLGKTLNNSHSASLHPGVSMGSFEFNAGG